MRSHTVLVARIATPVLWRTVPRGQSFPAKGRLRHHTDILQPASQIVASDPQLAKAWTLAFATDTLSHAEWTSAIMDLANSDQPVVQAAAFIITDGLCDQGYENAGIWTHRYLPGMSLAARSLLVNISIAYSENDGTTRVRCIGEEMQRTTGVSLAPPAEFTPRALHEWLKRIIKSADDRADLKEDRGLIRGAMKILDDLSTELVPNVIKQSQPSNPTKDVVSRAGHVDSKATFSGGFNSHRWVIALTIGLVFGAIAYIRFRK